MNERQFFSEAVLSDTEILASATVHGLLTLARLSNEHKGDKPATRKFLTAYIAHLVDPAMVVSISEEREVVRRLGAFDLEAAARITDAVAVWITELDNEQ